MVKEERDIVEVPVCSGSQLENKRIKDVAWPARTLVVDIMRGQEQLVPEKNTIIRAGDFLYILTQTETAEEVRALGSDLRNGEKQ